MFRFLCPFGFWGGRELLKLREKGADPSFFIFSLSLVPQPTDSSEGQQKVRGAKTGRRERLPLHRVAMGLKKFRTKTYYFFSLSVLLLHSPAHIVEVDVFSRDSVKGVPGKLEVPGKSQKGRNRGNNLIKLLFFFLN